MLSSGFTFDIALAASYVAIYEEFRIVKATLHYKPSTGAGGSASTYSVAGALTSFSAPYYRVAIGEEYFDSGTSWTSIAQAFDNDARILDGRLPHIQTFTPRALTANGQYAASPWMSCADNAATLHYGVKSYIEFPVVNVTAGQYFCETGNHMIVHIQFRNN